MQAILKLSRWQESIPFVIPLTLLGGLMAYRFADVRLDERLLYVLLANILAVIYAFMINDIEDAEDDQKGDPERAKRNVIASGELSKGDGWMASVGAALLALILYTLSGAYALYAGFIILDLGHLYSWKPIRLKALPVLDIVSHVLMLSALLLLAAYFVYDTAPGEVWLLVVSMTLISAYGQLYNQLRDFEADRAAGL
ncbi:MAG TPA: UbiA family prenyltransferase, partial [Aggregatilineales bacterium]|nr:UbiA family prenyltransferase [Aggregatilineales bacterium]